MPEQKAYRDVVNFVHKSLSFAGHKNHDPAYQTAAKQIRKRLRIALALSEEEVRMRLFPRRLKAKRREAKGRILADIVLDADAAIHRLYRYMSAEEQDVVDWLSWHLTTLTPDDIDTPEERSKRRGELALIRLMERDGIDAWEVLSDVVKRNYYARKRQEEAESESEEQAPEENLVAFPVDAAGDPEYRPCPFHLNAWCYRPTIEDGGNE